MNIQLLALTLVIGTSIFALAWSLLPEPEPGLLQRRLENVAVVDELDADAMELAQPLRDRLFMPVLNNLNNFLLRHTKGAQIQATSALIQRAGSTMRAETFIAIRMISLVVGGAIGFGMSTLMGTDGSGAIMIPAVGTILGYVYPSAKLKGKAKKRGNEIRRGLPGLLDLLIIAMEAGLTFDMALMRVADEDPGPLGREFAKVIYEMRLGRPRIESLLAMAERNDIDELTGFVRSVAQAEPLGVSIANVLRVQAEEMRRIRRQRAEEKGHKAPVKMLLPMMGCIFPCIFIILLGPAAITVMHSMST